MDNIKRDDTSTTMMDFVNSTEENCKIPGIVEFPKDLFTQEGIIIHLLMNCIPVHLSNITDPGLHRKLQEAYSVYLGSIV